jgi:hypothetical protein
MGHLEMAMFVPHGICKQTQHSTEKIFESRSDTEERPRRYRAVPKCHFMAYCFVVTGERPSR